MGKLLTGILLVIAVLIVGVGIASWRWYFTPVVGGSKAVDVDVSPGKPLRAVAAELHAQGVLPQPLDLVLLARLRGDANSIRAGEYLAEPGISVAGLLELLRSGRVVMHSLTLVEGWTFKQVLQAVEQDPALQHTLTPRYGDAIMTKLGHAGENPEGRLFPNTYQFPKGTMDAAFLERAYRLMQNHLKAAWQARAKNLPYTTPYDALILASVIEKETARPFERAEIAGRVRAPP